MGKCPIYSKCRNGFVTAYFVLKVLVILNIVPQSMDTWQEPAFIDFWAFKLLT